MPLPARHDGLVLARGSELSFIARFEAKFIPVPDGCWQWSASRSNQGRGQFKVAHRKTAFAPRVMWLLLNGAIPEGNWVCHRCDNPACVRPDHLFLACHVANMRDMAAKGRNGHRRWVPFDIRRAAVARSRTTRIAVVAAEFGVHVVTISKWRNDPRLLERSA